MADQRRSAQRGSGQLQGCVKKIVTELAVLDVLPGGGFKLLERAPGISVEEIKNATAGKLVIEGDVPEMVI